jgi:peptidoglycan/xylan/chitin deacetylase (PgdA/CDA1 family)
MTSLRSRLPWVLRYLFCSVFFYSGAWWVWKRFRYARSGGRAVILAYHGVRTWGRLLEMFCEPEAFRGQMKFAAGYYDVITLDELIERRARGPLKRDCIVVTFDDGYADNIEVAWPIAKALSIPMHVYIATQLVERGCTTSVDALIRMVEVTKTSQVDLQAFGLGVLPLGTASERETFVKVVDRYVKLMSFSDRVSVLDAVAVRLGVPETQWRSGMMTWQQVRRLSEEGARIGAHSRTHAVLLAQSDEALSVEVAGSKEDLERVLRHEVKHFAYPFGGPEEVDARVRAVVAKEGFSTAVVLQETEVDVSRPHQLGRFMVTTDRSTSPWSERFSRAIFACEIEGVTRSLARLVRPRDASADSLGA